MLDPERVGTDEQGCQLVEHTGNAPRVAPRPRLSQPANAAVGGQAHEGVLPGELKSDFENLDRFDIHDSAPVPPSLASTVLR